MSFADFIQVPIMAHDGSRPDNCNAKKCFHSLKALTKLKIKDDFDGCKITAYYARLTKYQFALK